MSDASPSVVELFHAVVSTIHHLSDSTKAMNAVERPSDLQAISDGDLSPFFIAKQFQGATRAFMNDQSFEKSLPSWSRLDWLQARESVESVYKILDVVGHDWDGLYPRGQDIVGVLRVAGQKDKIESVMMGVSEGYHQALDELKYIALPNVRFLVADLKIG